MNFNAARILLNFFCLAALLFPHFAYSFPPRQSIASSAVRSNIRSTPLYGKKDKKGGNYKANAAPSKAEKQGREDRFDAMSVLYFLLNCNLT
jgi:branched-subunit amino acid aminotransferase/4-amino-4-deoxychorismate lyase